MALPLRLCRQMQRTEQVELYLLNRQRAACNMQHRAADCKLRAVCCMPHTVPGMGTSCMRRAACSPRHARRVGPGRGRDARQNQRVLCALQLPPDAHLDVCCALRAACCEPRVRTRARTGSESNFAAKRCAHAMALQFRRGALGALACTAATLRCNACASVATRRGVSQRLLPSAKPSANAPT